MLGFSNLGAGQALGGFVLLMLVFLLVLWATPTLTFMGISYLFGVTVPAGIMSKFWFWILYLIIFWKPPVTNKP